MSSSSSPSPMPPASSWTEQLSQPANLLSAAKWGVITAAAYIVIGFLVIALYAVLRPVVGNNPTVLAIPVCIGIFAQAFGIYVAGYLPSAERGNIPTGVVGAVIMIALIEIYNLISSHVQNANAQANSGSIIVQIISVVLLLGIAIGIGWTGAFYGVKRNIKTEASK
jgi:hypothetical protein